jgi:hypothetical protein
MGFKWLLKRSAPASSSVQLDRKVARNPQRFHTRNLYNLPTFTILFLFTITFAKQT